MQGMSYHFRPAWLPTIATLLLIALFIKLGLWQWHKAEQKKALQATFDARLKETPSVLPHGDVDIEQWRYRRIRVHGRYDTSHQILLDNQVHGEAAGYDVITPLLPDGGGPVLLVDRGWIPVGDRSRLPEIVTPDGVVEATGFAWVPPDKFFELQAPSAKTEWQPVWQNMDLQRYRAMVNYSVLPFVLRLDANADAGGFMREWPRPAERIETHVGYAYQWFGFAVALLLIYLVVNIKKQEHE